jgi:hypothetical protein
VTVPPGPPRPAPPMPQWRGIPVTWGPWEVAPVVFLCPPPKEGVGCPECKGTDLLEARAMTDRLWIDGKRTPSRIAARATRCDTCGHVWIIGADPFEAACMILCDDCDAPAAAGATWEEARESLVRILGGWTGAPAADWDRCGACAHDGVLRVLR